MCTSNNYNVLHWSTKVIHLPPTEKRNTSLPTLHGRIQCGRRGSAATPAPFPLVVEPQPEAYLTNNGVKALIVRRDEIVAIFEKLVAEKGESNLLY